MATCKDCLHVEVCRYYTNELAKANGIPLKLEEVERLLGCDDCENFKARSRFVELPCKIGDIGYGLYRRCPKHGKANPIIKRGLISAIQFNLNMDLIVTVHRIATGIVGKTVFLTREEAEQALKERIENDA